MRLGLPDLDAVSQQPRQKQSSFGADARAGDGPLACLRVAELRGGPGGASSEWAHDFAWMSRERPVAGGAVERAADDGCAVGGHGDVRDEHRVAGQPQFDLTRRD